MSTLLPARINLQIHTGSQNALAGFEVEVFASHLRDDGHTDHDVSVYSVIGGLATALRDQIRELRDRTTEPGEAEAWLSTMRDWTFEELGS